MAGAPGGRFIALVGRRLDPPAGTAPGSCSSDGWRVGGAAPFAPREAVLTLQRASPTGSARDLPPEARLRGHARTGGGGGRARPCREAPLHGAQARRNPAPLRPSARGGWRARQLGLPEGPELRPRPEASRGGDRGPPARLRRLRGPHPRRRVRRRRQHHLGPRHLRHRAPGADAGPATEGAPAHRHGRPEAEGRLAPRPDAAAGRQGAMAALQGEGRDRAPRLRRRRRAARVGGQRTPGHPRPRAPEPAPGRPPRPRSPARPGMASDARRALEGHARAGEPVHVRGEVRRLSRARRRLGREGRGPLAERPRLRHPLPVGAAGPVPDRRGRGGAGRRAGRVGRARRLALPGARRLGRRAPVHGVRPPLARRRGPAEAAARGAP